MTIIKAPSGASFFMHEGQCDPVNYLATDYPHSNSVATLIQPVKMLGWNFHRWEKEHEPITIYVAKEDAAKAIANADREGLKLVYNDLRSVECPAHLVALISDGNESEIVRKKFRRSTP